MATATSPETGRPKKASPNGAVRRAGDVSVAPPRRRVRGSELAVGLVVVAVFAAGGVYLHLRSVDRVSALAVASPIERGEAITGDALRVVYVSSDSPLARVDESELDTVVGQVAVADLAAGTLLSPDLVVPESGIGAEDGVVGLLLEPGQYPSVSLAPGDVVNVVPIGSEGMADDLAELADALEDDEDGSGLALVRDAEVLEVSEMASDRRLVTVRASEAEADRIAAVEAGGLQLVQVSP